MLTKLCHFTRTVCLFALLLGTATSATAKSYSWDVKFTAKIGQEYPAQDMYNIIQRGDAATCKWDSPPPKPEISKAPKLGQIRFVNTQKKAKANQCPNVSVDTSRAFYRAGTTKGIDRFVIKWTASNNRYVVRFKIKVE